MTTLKLLRKAALLQFLTGAPGQLSPSVNNKALETQQPSKDILSKEEIKKYGLYMKLIAYSHSLFLLIQVTVFVE